MLYQSSWNRILKISENEITLKDEDNGHGSIASATSTTTNTHGENSINGNDTNHVPPMMLTFASGSTDMETETEMEDNQDDQDSQGNQEEQGIGAEIQLSQIQLAHAQQPINQLNTNNTMSRSNNNNDSTGDVAIRESGLTDDEFEDNTDNDNNDNNNRIRKVSFSTDIIVQGGSSGDHEVVMSRSPTFGAASQSQIEIIEEEKNSMGNDNDNDDELNKVGSLSFTNENSYYDELTTDNMQSKLDNNHKLFLLCNIYIHPFDFHVKFNHLNLLQH